MINVERRIHAASQLEVRARQDGGHTLTGYAAVWNRMSENLGGFVERIAPGAFTKTLTEADIRHLFNHDPNLVLGRNRSGTLRLAEDSTGLHYEVDLPNTQLARDLAEMVARGDVSGSSFAFRTVGPDGDEWTLTDDGFPLRTIHQAQLYDTSTVTYPAYPSTQETDVKAAVRSLAATAERSVDEIAQLAAAGELRSLIVGEAPPVTEPRDTHSAALAHARALLDATRR